MKRTLALALCFAMLFVLAIPAFAASPIDAIIGNPADNSNLFEVTANRLNVRVGPSTTYDKTGLLKKGDQIIVLNIDDCWAEILWNGNTAFVHINYILQLDHSDPFVVYGSVAKSLAPAESPAPVCELQ